MKHMSNQNLSPAKTALLERWLRGQLKNTVATIPRRDPNSPIPLSFPQQRQLFLELIEPGKPINNLSSFISVNGKLDLSAVEQSVNRIIARHDALRTKFSFGHGIPTVEVVESINLNVTIIDLQGLEIDAQEREGRRLAEIEVLKPLDLTKPPLLRITLYKLSNENNLLLLIVHHTIADGWSLGVFLYELMVFYREVVNHQYTQLPELSIQYADYASWQTTIKGGKVFQPEMDYWKKQLDGALPILQLPTDFQRGSRQTFSGGTHRFVLSPKIMDGIEKLCREDDVTLFMVLLTSFYILLHRFSAQDEILVGTPVANRNLPELENLIGVFINTLVLRTNVADHSSFRGLLKRVRHVSLEAYAHQNLPFEKLVEELKPKRELSLTPLFQVLFNLQNTPMPKLDIPGLDIRLMEIDRGVSQFDLTLMMSTDHAQLHGVVEYNSDLFLPETIQRMFQSFQIILEDAVIDPELPISKLRLITDEAYYHVVNKLNQTDVEFPVEKCMHQLFEEQVEQTPHAVAVVYNDKAISYSELNNRANVMAQRFKTLGVGPGVRVGVLMEKSLEIVEALLGVLKAGGAYVPISTSFPADRLQYILNDAKIQVLLTNVDAVMIGDLSVHVVNLHDNRVSTQSDCLNPAICVSGKDLAYIIYTSGSSGQPKGVMVNHSALVNFLISMRARPGIKKDDLLLSVTAISFDIAALELFLPLIVGATVIILSKETSTNPFRLTDAVSRYPVTIMQATPATWQLLVDSGWTGKPGLNALCGGELLGRKLANQLLDRVGTLWNMYGPTETTIWSSASRIHSGDSPITIGTPIANTQMYILDGYLQPVPIGVVGELHIGGEGLATGYLNHPELTSEKFIPHCFSNRHGARLYKTGDRARYLTDFSIEFLGRIDDQVKINGHRIEPGEIVAVLMQHPSVQEAVVVTATGESGEKKIFAYVVTENGESPDVSELREHVRKKLPSYMMPAEFIRLMNMPLTPNGKINRNALPVPGETRRPIHYAGPRDDLEQALTNIWENVLDIERVGIHDNFFDLGGASIQSLQVVASANYAGIYLTAESIFEHQTIAELTEAIKNNLIASDNACSSSA